MLIHAYVELQRQAKTSTRTTTYGASEPNASEPDGSSDAYDPTAHQDEQDEDEDAAEDGLVPDPEDLDLVALNDNGDALEAAVRQLVSRLVLTRLTCP